MPLRRRRGWWCRLVVESATYRTRQPWSTSAVTQTRQQTLSLPTVGSDVSRAMLHGREGRRVSMALPRVLAGPIVRRVEPASCSFWVALSEQATVTARVWLGEKSAPVPDSEPAARRSVSSPPAPSAPACTSSSSPSTRRARRSSRRALLVRPEVRARRRHDVGPARREAARGRGPGGADHRRRSRGSAASRPRASRRTSCRRSSPRRRRSPPTEPPTPAAGLRLAHASCRRPGSGAVDALAGPRRARQERCHPRPPAAPHR